MSDLTITLPLPIVLFIINIALALSGYLLGREPRDKEFWIVMGFIELGYAFLCLLIVPLIDFQFVYWGTVAFVLGSLGISCFASLSLTRRAR